MNRFLGYLLAFVLGVGLGWHMTMAFRTECQQEEDDGTEEAVPVIFVVPQPEAQIGNTTDS